MPSYLIKHMCMLGMNYLTQPPHGKKGMFPAMIAPQFRQQNPAMEARPSCNVLLDRLIPQLAEQSFDPMIGKIIQGIDLELKEC